MKSKSEESCVAEDFSLKQATQAWLQREYPQLDEARTVEAFIEWAQNQRDNNKRSATYGQVLKCFNWQAKFKNVVRIQVTNKWSTIAIAKQGQEVDTRWTEVLTHAKAIGCPVQRRPSDTSESFRTRVKQWELFDKPKEKHEAEGNRRVIDFGSLTKTMRV